MSAFSRCEANFLSIFKRKKNEGLETVINIYRFHTYQIDVEASRGDVVDDVHRGVDELALVGRRDEPDEDLEGEPGVADALDVEEGDVGVGVLLVDEVVGAVVGRADGRRLDHRHFHVGVGLQAEGEDRDADEEDGQNAYHL